MEKLTIVYIVLLVSGAVPLILCITKMIMLKNFKNKAVKVMATITHVEKRIRFKGSRYYLLTLKYNLAATNQLWNAHANLFKKYQPGDEVPLWYLPDKPTKFSIDNGKRYPYAFAFTGVFFLLIVWFCYWLSNLEYTTDL